MKVIQQPNSYILEAYKEKYGTKDPNKMGKISQFVLTIPVNEGMLLYNTVTKELVLTGDEDLFSDYFYEHLFVLNEDVNELDMAYDLKCRIFTYRPREFHVNGYTIITTTECNARCFYCYEKGCKQISMSDKVAQDTADFILKTTPKEELISISWFGGEPLYNQRPIDIITNRLTEAGRKFTSSIVTNGYYFNEETIKKAKENWHITNAQITIDGLTEKYNKAKNYIDSNDSNPFETVIGNIERLIEADIFVCIRINIGQYNIDEAFELSDYLTERLKIRPDKYTIYPHALFEKYANDIDEDNESYVFAKILEFEQKLYDLGFRGTIPPLTNEVRSYHCMADNKNSYVIQADGKIGLCEHLVDSDEIGSIYDEKFNDEKIKEFEEVADLEEKCICCPLYPECSRLKLCRDYECACTDTMQNFRIYERVKQIKRAYEAYLVEHQEISNGNELPPFLIGGDEPYICSEEKRKIIKYEWNKNGEKNEDKKAEKTPDC